VVPVTPASDPDRKALAWLTRTSMLAAGLTMVLPLVALVLVIVYAASGMHGELRIFFAFVAVMFLASAAAQAARLWFVLRLGRVGKVLRAEHPAKFWTGAAFHGLLFAVYAAGVVVLLIQALIPKVFAS
jgi:hypothetical protein